MRHCVTLGLILTLTILSGCVSERQFARDSWPFGNPNAPVNNSETAQRSLGKVMAVTPIPPQAGDVWPGPVQPVPTLNNVQDTTNLPLGQGYTPSLPSPYPPGQNPDAQPELAVPMPSSIPSSLPPLPAPPPIPNGGSLYSTQPGGGLSGVVPPVPGDAR